MRHLTFVLFSRVQPQLTARGLIYIIFSSVGVKVKLVRRKSSTLAVAPKGGKCRVLVL
jgi:hypothetical protein